MIRVESSHILCLVSASQHTQQLPYPLLLSHTKPDSVMKPFVPFDALEAGIISHIKKAPRGRRLAKTHLITQREKIISKHHVPLLADASSPNSSSITLSGLCRCCLWLWLSSLAQENTVPGYFQSSTSSPPPLFVSQRLEHLPLAARKKKKRNRCSRFDGPAAWPACKRAGKRAKSIKLDTHQISHDTAHQFSLQRCLPFDAVTRTMACLREPLGLSSQFTEKGGHPS